MNSEYQSKGSEYIQNVLLCLKCNTEKKKNDINKDRMTVCDVKWGPLQRIITELCSSLELRGAF